MKIWTTGNGTRVTRILGGRSNAFLLSRGQRNILVDTGRSAARRRLSGRLLGLGITRLDALVLTHTHFDHAENAAYIKEAFGARVIVHGAEERFLREGASPLPQGTTPVTRLLVRLAAMRTSSPLVYEPCRADVRVEDRFDLSGFGFDAYLLPTPGHSPGSISLILDGETAIVGDAMFGVLPCSVFPPFADDARQLISSWGILLDTGCLLFMPGHGSPDSRGLLEKCHGRRRRQPAKGSGAS